MFNKMLVSFLVCLRKEFIAMDHKLEMPRVGALGSVMGLTSTDIALP